LEFVSVRKIFLSILMSVFISFPALADNKTDTIYELIDKAIAHFPTVGNAQSRVDASLHGTDFAKAGHYPSLNFSGNYGPERAESTTISSSGASFRARVRRENSLVLSQNLYDWGATDARINQAEAEVSEARMSLVNNRQELIYRVITTYVKLRRLRTLLTNAQENLTEHNSISNLVLKRVAEKVDSQSSASLVQGRLAVAKLSVERYREMVKSTEAELAKYTGEIPGDLAELPGDMLAIEKEYGLDGHPVLAMINARLDTARAAVKEKEALFTPRLGLDLVARNDRDTSGIDGTTAEYGAYMTLEFNLYNGGADSAAHNREMELLRTTEFELKEEELNIKTALTVAYSELKVAQEELKYYTDSKREVEKAKTAYHSQYLAGKRTLFDLLNIQSEQFKATESFILATHSVKQKHIDIKFEAGVMDHSAVEEK
jgi:outer membrane protein, adhesin transport system